MGKNQSAFTGTWVSEWQWHQLGHMQICTSPASHHSTHTHTTILWPSWILSGTTWVSQYQKGKTREVKPIWMEQSALNNHKFGQLLTLRSTETFLFRSDFTYGHARTWNDL